MRALVVAVTLGLCAPAWAQWTPCTTQDYARPEKPPDWRCPGPDEGLLVPDIQHHSSIGMPEGAVYHKSPATSPVTLTYPAVLMDKAKVTQLGLKIQGLRRLRWLERHKFAELIRIERQYMSDRLTAQLKLEQSRVKVAMQQRDQARKARDRASAWYRSWSFGLVVGVVTTTAATLAVVYASR